jgi:hypothetical protein
MFISVPIISLSQQLRKFRSDEFMFKKDTDDDWSQLEKANTLIMLKDGRITIFSKIEQAFDVIKYNDAVDESDENKVCTTFECVDNEGIRCSIYFFTERGTAYMLSVNYANIKYAYLIREL